MLVITEAMLKKGRTDIVQVVEFDFYFTVDTTPPMVVCASTVSQTVPCGTPSAQVNFGVTSVSDNCGAVSVSYSSNGDTVFANNLQGNAAFNVGTSTVTATATDSSNLQTTCPTIVTITGGKYNIQWSK